jgi:hypothetical protein
MTLTTETKFNIGDPVYFIDVIEGRIGKGVITKVNVKIVRYRDKYTDELKDYVDIEYDLYSNYPDVQHFNEERLFSSPEEIMAGFQQQIKDCDYS